MFSRFLLAGALTLAPFLVLADEPMAGRYQLQPVDGGVVRLDTATGEMALCKAGAGALDCATLKPGTAASDIAALQARIDALERRVAAMKTDGGLPSDAEVDRSLSIMEKFMRKFMGLARELTPEPDRQNAAPGALPQKT
jgi:hypothetical protein